MLVTTRAASGEYELWRVGRRRLAFRPYLVDLLDSANPDDFAAVMVLIQLIPFLLLWCLALLSTFVVWPWRALTGRWLVVAYPTMAPAKARRQRTTSTAEARALVTAWADAIKAGRF